jgi:hypothetical protein
MISQEKPMVANVPKQKKTYKKPAITIYGTLGEITNTVGNSGNPDGGSPPHFKTRP